MDKGPAYALGMLVGGAAIILTFFLPHQSTGLIYLVAVLAGFGFAAQWIFPWAMVADVADYDRADTGQQRSGMYYGVWGLATKISEAVALAAVGWILTGFGYIPNVEQTSHALLGIRLFFGLIPAIIFVSAAVVPLPDHAQILRERRETGSQGSVCCRREKRHEPTRVAIVGCGRISDHQIGYRGRRCEDVAVCDTNKSMPQKAKEWGVEKIYTDYAGC
jgi:MFS family permease